MGKTIYRSIVMTLLLTLLLCGAYPLLVYGLGQVLFRQNANGGFIQEGDRVYGAALIGQSFTKPEYFHGRPSAAGQGYDAANSSGSNLGPTSAKLMENLRVNLKRVLEENPGLNPALVPVELVTASGSGLDPHLSPAGAEVQAERVAKARGLPVGQVQELIQEHTQGPQWGLFGESTVNVLQLNLALDGKHLK